MNRRGAPAGLGRRLPFAPVLSRSRRPGLEGLRRQRHKPLGKLDGRPEHFGGEGKEPARASRAWVGEGDAGGPFSALEDVAAAGPGLTSAARSCARQR